MRMLRSAAGHTPSFGKIHDDFLRPSPKCEAGVETQATDAQLQVQGCKVCTLTHTKFIIISAPSETAADMQGEAGASALF